MTIPVLTIDGPSGSGKGTVARRVAERLGWHLLDSGALYRLVGLSVREQGVAADDHEKITEIARNLPVRFGSTSVGDEQIWLDEVDVTLEVRTEKAGEGASKVAAIPSVRSALLDLQRGFRQSPGLVADGRDMGTCVFRDAELKIFLTASPEERAQRRYKQLKLKGIGVNLAALSQDIRERDRRDSTRSVAPLVPAEDSRYLDSSDLSIAAVTDTVLDWAQDVWELQAN